MWPGPTTVPRFARVTFLVAAILCAQRAQCNDAPSVTLALQFDHRFSVASLKEMKREFERIMLPAKVRIEWRMTDDLTGGESFQEVVVARFKGNCEAGQTGAAGAALPHLGMTHVISGDVSPFAELECNSIRALLARNAAPETTFQLQRMLGLAMARVLAHELYHAVLGTPRHGAHGIAKASLTPSDLFGGPIGFEPDQIERIEEALTSAADSHSRSTVTLSLLPVKVRGTW